MLIVGDVHGKVHDYMNLVEGYSGSTFQLGDFGFKDAWNFSDRLSPNHRIGQGNHDPHDTLHYHRAFIGHRFGLTNHGLDFFWIGGELSIDMVYRVGEWYSDKNRQTWWSNEELDFFEMKECERQYLEVKPSIVIAHSCPGIISDTFCKNDMMQRFGWGRIYKSRTQQFMTHLWQLHQPLIWVFGHFHSSQNFEADKTRFICLNELETLEL